MRRVFSILLGIALVVGLVLPSFIPPVEVVSADPGNETCQRYVARRLSEGWEIIEQDGFFVVLQSPDGNILKTVDLRNDIETLRPNASGSSAEFSRSTASANWQCVDEEIADDDGSYVYAKDNNQVDFYNVANSGVGEGTINSINVFYRVEHYDASDRYGWLGIKSGATESWGDYTMCPLSWENKSRGFATDPNTGLAWTWSAIDSLQVGLKVSSQGIRCTQIYVEVNYSPPVSAPTVTTQAVSSIATTTATGNGTITDDGGETPSAWGVCVAETENPDINDDVFAGSGAGEEAAFTASITGLTPGTLYHARAYATNSEGTSYGGDVTFTTKPNPPTGLGSSSVEETTATVSWSAPVAGTVTGYYIRYKTGSYPTGYTDGSGYTQAEVTKGLTSLSPGTDYYCRVWSYKTGSPNPGGCSDSYSQHTFTTDTAIPTVTYRLLLHRQ